MKTYKVESFQLDHTQVEAPYIRVADQKHFVQEGEVRSEFVISKFDIRFTQPNVDFLATATIHSLEHLLAENIRTYSDHVIDVSPMGCRTGFYVILQGAYTVEEVYELLTATLRDVVEATEVPACNEVQCGNYRDHDLEAAKKEAIRFLSHSKEFLQTFIRIT